MPAPATSVITSPVTGFTKWVGPGDSYTTSVTGTTDADTPVELLDGVTSKGTGTSNGSGAFTFASKVFAIGSHSLTVRAGTDPDFTTSTAVVITVTDAVTPIARADDRSVAWYLNFLAGTSAANMAANLLLTPKDAACDWAGVSRANFTYTGALNSKAGITDPTLWVSVNKALNLIAYGTTNPDLCRPWLTDQQALLKIALA